MSISPICGEFNKKVDNFTMASRFADSLTDGIFNRSFNTYISNMAYNGLEAKDNLDDITNQLNRIYKTDIGTSLTYIPILIPILRKPLMIFGSLRMIYIRWRMIF